MLTAETCACGSDNWHKPLDGGRHLWCRKCGAVRPIFQQRWYVPLEQAGKLSHTRFSDEEPPTSPDGKPH